MPYGMARSRGARATQTQPSRKILPFGEKAYNFAFRPINQDARINILEGAVRSSKTWALMAKIIQLCQYEVSGVRLITGVSKESVYVNVLNDLFEVIGTNAYHYNRSSGELEMLGCWWKVVGANDETSEKYIRGATVGAAVGDELTKQPQSFFVMLMNRLSPRGARFYGSTNPDSPFHWLKTDWIDNKELIDAGDIRTLHFDLDDNPHLSKNYKDFLNRAYKGVYHLRFVKGLWVIAEGGIYKDAWSEDLIYDDESFPGIRRLREPRGAVDRWVSMDYGTVHRHVYLDMIDDGTNVYVDREWIWDSVAQGVQKTDRQYADDLEKFLQPAHGPLVIVPPECASFKAELVQRGIWNIDAENAVADGIRTVSTMMSLKRLRIHRRCTNLIERIGSYVWDPNKAKRGIEEPIKANDDEVDACRYGIATKIAPWRLAA
ncbi:MAG: phage terminase large subunit [Syntrophorhabdales bacterium]